MIFRRTESVNSKEETEVGSQYPCTWQSLISRSCISTTSQSCSSKLYYISKTDSDPPLPPPPIQSQSIYSTARIVIFGLNKLHRVLKIESVDEILNFLVHRSSLHHSSNKHSITSAPFSIREQRKKEKEEEEEEEGRKKKEKSTTSAWKEQTHASIIAWKNLKRAKEPRRIFTSETRRAVAATPVPPRKPGSTRGFPFDLERNNSYIPSNKTARLARSSRPRFCPSASSSRRCFSREDPRDPGERALFLCEGIPADAWDRKGRSEMDTPWLDFR